ncbi:LysR substrate-binding domain-containing protein [Vibrio amylolyticus]|uniref:LysR substrate-binding domain-containing protein n=1 Tax=Vibrio amylolyticus TaxID=2847292 RepID=UPI0035530439
MESRLPPLNTLKVFHTAAKMKSFKKAAEALNVTPTAVSHQIRSLEDALKTSLFERKTRAIELTSEGEKLAEVTQSVFQQISNVVNEISSTKNVITVSTTSSFAAMWLIPKLEVFYAAHPDIEVVIKTGEKVEDLERDKRIDLAIRYGVFDGASAHGVELIREEIGMYATPSYLSQLDALDNVHLLETTWKNSHLPSISWHSLFDENRGQAKPPVRQFDQEHHVIQAALASQGIALVSSLLVENPLQQGWLEHCDFVQTDHQREGHSYYLLIPEHNIRSQSILKFEQWILSEMNPKLALTAK